MQHSADVGAPAYPKDGGGQQLQGVYPGRHCGPAVDCGEHSSLLSMRLLHLLQHSGQVGIQDSEIPPSGRLSPHCREVDENEYLSVRQILLHLRNEYATLSDVILKNIEKIKIPRSTNSDNLYR
ncbi:uncharacterized protein LOC101175891 [Nomascus leucogenys]|uniref:uncharacterized protein LOC101175891 n=1 Tax=Nomascus leucogenys TaxID=61853 RepID=UPI00062A5564|nr:uncharacterized protein LOC101175891 [Nomascus leucogenys]